MEVSEPRLVANFLIQSSVLGPLFFRLYFEDVFRATRNGVPLLAAEGNEIVYTFCPEALESKKVKYRKTWRLSVPR